MTFFIEICGPFQWRPGWFRSRRMFRIWYGYIAIGFMRGDMHEFHQRAANGETEWSS